MVHPETMSNFMASCSGLHNLSSQSPVRFCILEVFITVNSCYSAETAAFRGESSKSLVSDVRLSLVFCFFAVGFPS